MSSKMCWVRWSVLAEIVTAVGMLKRALASKKAAGEISIVGEEVRVMSDVVMTFAGRRLDKKDFFG